MQCRDIFSLSRRYVSIRMHQLQCRDIFSLCGRYVTIRMRQLQCRDIFSLSGRYVSIRMHKHVDIGLWRLHVQRRLRRYAARAVRLLPHASWHTRPVKQGHHFGAGRRFRRHGEDGVSTMMCLYVCVCLFLAFVLPVAFDACAWWKRGKHTHHVICMIYVLFALILHLYWGLCLRKDEFRLRGCSLREERTCTALTHWHARARTDVHAKALRWRKSVLEAWLFPPSSPQGT